MADFPLNPQAGLALGIIVGLLSTCVQSVGLTLQRKSHMLEDEKEDHHDKRPPYRRRRWQIGMFLFLVANIVGSTIQIVALPLPLLSTLQASGLVFNSILASLLLKEPWTWRSAYGTVLVAAGAVLISFFSAVPEPSHTLQQLLVLLREPAFLVWFILSFMLAVVVIAVTFTLRKCIPNQRSHSPRVMLVNGMIFGLVSGILSAHALLLAKSAVELIVRSLSSHQNQFRSWEPWVLLVAFLVLSLSQLYYLHLGLKLISTSVLYPFVFCIYNIVAILDGLIYFQQMDKLPPLHAGLIALGTVLLLAGVLALSWRLEAEEDDEHPHIPKAEIPQTILGPGMGFVEDPDTASDDESVHSDDLETEHEAGEHSKLLRKSLSRSRTTTNKVPNYVPGHSHIHTSKRRHRAATLREMRAIWEALGDSDDYYGTFDRSNSAAPSRPSTSDRDRRERRRRSSGQRPLAQEDTERRISRAATLPSGGGRSRRKSSYHGSALFSDMLKSDWWSFKRKGHDRDDDGEESRSCNHDRRGSAL